ncbi:MAG: PDZ domain-containing protein [Ferruginibacter sp.]
MKKIMLSIIGMAFLSVPLVLKAQDEKPEKKEKEEKIEKKEKSDKKFNKEKKETQEIVIRNKGDKDLKLKVEIDGDKITVNGKPLAEFKEDGVTINNRKMIIRNGDGMMAYNFGGADGINFSKDFMGEWKGNGKEMIKPFLGVTTEGVSEGAKITEVVKESAAEKAGLKKGDIITKVGDETISDGGELSEVIAAKKPKEVVKVTYLRSGKENSIKATLGEKKIKTGMTFSYNAPRARVRSFSVPRIQGPDGDMFNGEGLNELGALNPAEGFRLNPNLFENSFPRQKRLGLKIQDTEEGGNVKVIDVEEGSAAEKAGLKKEDVITEIGGVKIENTDDARKQLFPSEAKPGYTIKAKRGGSEMTFEVKFPKKLKTANL